MSVCFDVPDTSPAPLHSPPHLRHYRLIIVIAAAAAVVIGVVTVAVVAAVRVLQGVATPSTEALPLPPLAPAIAGAIAARVDPGLADVTGTVRGMEVAGTGMVLTPSGLVLTNNHVIEGANAIAVTDVANHIVYRASVLGYDESQDIAVLQLIGASRLKTVTLGNSSAVRMGEQVVALGNAGGVGGTPGEVTGAVTALSTSLTAMDPVSGIAEPLTGLIRSNAPIQPGDSGGALANSAGEVIGMNTASSKSNGQSDAISAFAVPIAQASSICAAIVAGRGSPTIHIGPTASMGIQVAQSATVAPGHKRVTGVRVTGVAAGMPAAAADLADGDVIIAFGGNSVGSAAALRDARVPYHPGIKSA